MRFLIVEDEQISRKKMCIILKNYGICDEALNGVQAISAFKNAHEINAPYDIITLDIGLEDMSGMDVLVSMREIEQSLSISPAKQAKVIMVTAQGGRDHVITCMTAKCDGYIVKPFTKETITRCLYNIYQKHIKDFWYSDISI